MGCEPPRALERSITSGIMPACSKENILPERPMPHWISSQIRGISSSLVILRISLRNSMGAGMTPPSPWMGSRMTAAGFVIPLSGSLSSLSKYAMHAFVPASPPSPMGQRYE